jgi:hypothetical protein
MARTRIPVPAAPKRKPAATKRVGRGGNAPTRRGRANLPNPSGPPKGPPKPPGFKAGGVVKKKTAKKKATKK